MIKSLRHEYGNKGQGHRNNPLIPFVLIIVLAAAIFTFYNLGTPPVELDNRLCPKTGARGATILLLDTSDPLTSKHKEELGRLAKLISSEDSDKHESDDGNSFRIDVGELFVVYELRQDPGSPELLIEVCRPQKSPSSRTWRDDIRQGSRFAKKEWESFEKALENLFPQSGGKPQPSSPILETIAVISARHAPGKRGNREFETHLIIFSDMMQNTDLLSHYRTYPEAKAVRQVAPDLLTDLTGVSVSLFFLKRTDPQNPKLQDKKHYYWWTELVMEQGGKIINQEIL